MIRYEIKNNTFILNNNPIVDVNIIIIINISRAKSQLSAKLFYQLQLCINKHTTTTFI